MADAAVLPEPPCLIVPFCSVTTDSCLYALPVPPLLPVMNSTGLALPSVRSAVQVLPPRSMVIFASCESMLTFSARSFASRIVPSLVLLSRIASTAA